jgi:replicative DNA helicase
VNEVTAAQAVKLLRHDIQERIEGRGEQGMNTGLHIFDSRWGWHTGDLIVMAGRTSQGKSTLAMTIARNMAMNGIPSVYYSLEMGAKQLTARMMARDCQLTSSRMLYDKLNDDELTRFDKASEGYKQLPIYYDDKSKTSFSRICTSIRAMVRQHGVRVAYIDYLQILVNSSKTDNRESLLGDMARDLKRLAVELNICIVAVSQLSRSKDKPEPTLAELRGSGQIEEACDVAVLVYRPFVYGIERYKDGRLTVDTAQLTIAKGRNIGLAQEVVAFNGELTYFYDIKEKTEQERMADATNKPWAKQSDTLPF